MKSLRRWHSVLAMLLLFAGCVVTASAQNPPAQNPPQEIASDFSSSTPSSAPVNTNTDPPGRVARFQYISGEVSIQPAGVNDWVAAEMNRPLTTSDRVWTDKNSKAELNVGGAYLRMNSESSLTLTNVGNDTVQAELFQGTLEVTVRHLGPGQIYEIDSPNLAFTVMKPGVYRFNVFPDEDQTWVTVRQGYGEATGHGNAVKIKAGQQVRFSADTSLQYTAEAAPAPDGFDDWASVRDKRLDSSLSAQYVAPGVIGYQDLDTYGYWQTVAPYGPVWVPNSVPVGWAPYRFGRWAWIAPWGWTWVDNAPWGFAPFHYGRWVYTGGYWGWAPGPYRFWSPYYAPALVGWIGGPGFGFGFGFGAGWGLGFNCGWFPLGWGEPFYPWYRGWNGRGLSRTYIRNVNVTNTHVTNVTNVTNNFYNNHITNVHYANRTVNGAVTAAPQSAIAGGQQINRVGRAVPSADLGHAQMVRGIRAVPTRAGLLGGDVPRTNAVPPGATFNRSMVTHVNPPRVPQTMQARPNTPSPAASPSAYAVRAPNSGTVTGGNPTHYVPRSPAVSGNSDFAAHPGAAQSGLSQSAAESRVPRPPAGYAYHAPPAYAAGAAHTYTAAPGYSAHGSYSAAQEHASAPAYHGSPASSFAGRGTVPYVPHSAEPAAGYSGGGPHYSALAASYAGGAAHYAAPSGVSHSSGESHAMHASGGGHSR
jgi:hypothetical protein